MTKSQLIDLVAAEYPMWTKAQAEQVVSLMFTSIVAALQRGDKVEIRGFGSFRLRGRRAKVGRNPKTGAMVSIPAKQVPFFKASKDWKELMNESAESGSES